MSRVAVVILTVLGMAVLAARGDSKAVYRFPNARTAAEVPSELAARLAVFRSDRTPADVPPPRPAFPAPPGHPAPPDSAAGGPQAFGENDALSRRVRDTGVYLVAGSQGVCFRSASHVEDGCQPTANVLRGDDAQAVICSPFLDPDVREVYGVLPDDVRQATVAFADGSTQPLTVERNAYIVRTRVPDPLPTAIAWSAPDGHHEVTAAMPADANETRCARPEDLARLARG
jgi:hypothetical protein